MEISGVWPAVVLGGLPLLGLLFWWWNELRYVLPLKLQRSATGAKLPPGHMGFPFIGELLTFLWYGDGVGMYRTHLFGSPSIITCFPAVNKFVFQSSDIFTLVWPSNDLLGHKSLFAVHGKSHERLKSYITKVINQPDALRGIALLVQPHMIASLESWTQKGRINAYDEVKKMTLENIGKLFLSLEAGPLLDTIDRLFGGLTDGLRAQPFNIPGSAFHHALQCRKKLEAIFGRELEKKKTQKKGLTNDLMDGLMQIKDDKGDKLSDQEVIDNIVSLVVGGYASTSLASMWAIYCLAKYPNVLEKLRVVEETIRMANSAACIFRLATKEAEYKGYKIPKGWNVILWVRYIHTDPNNFDDPMIFNPDRWNEPAKPGTFQVFGGGTRICAGNMLARMELAIFLHHLSTKYKWELRNPNAEVVYLSFPKPADGVDIMFSKI